MPLINKIGRFSFLIMLGLVIITALFPQALLSVYTNETALINESVSSVYVICVAMLIASVANVVFNGISGTGNTQAADARSHHDCNLRIVHHFHRNVGESSHRMVLYD